MPRLRTIVLFVCLSLSYGLMAQKLSIQAALDRAEMKTGEQAVIDVTIRTSNVQQTKYHLMERSDEPPRFVVLSFGATDTIDLDGTTKEIRAKILITSFDSTLISIPPIMAVHGTDTAITTSLALSIIQPEVDLNHPEDIKGIKELWAVEYTIEDLLILLISSPWLWLSIGLALITYGVYRYKKFRATRPASLAPETRSTPVVKTPLQELEEKLKALEGKVCHSQEEYKALYSRLVEALKIYLHQTEGWAWQEMTSSEIRSFLLQTDAPINIKQSINTLLSDADMSKFAKGTPSEADVKASLRAARDIAQSVDERQRNRLAITEEKA